MICGLSCIGLYIYLMSHFDTISLKEGKNFLIIMPILFILAFVELFAEIKFGIKKIFSWIKNLIIKIKNKIKYSILERKIKKGKKPSDKDLEWLAKHKGELLKDAS